MEFTIKLQAEQVNLILTGLNKLEHGVVRAAFDLVVSQVQKQELAAQAAQEATPSSQAD